MELFKNIFFNTDKIVENTEIKVTYAGYLFQNGSPSVNLYYGYGENWENSGYIVMEKTDLGFQANVCVGSGTTLNFCFNNDNGEWDNNQGQDYKFAIEQDQIIDAIIEQDVPVDGFVPEDDDVTTVTNNNGTQTNTQNTTSLCKTQTTWAELFKRTWNNLVNFITKLFSGDKDSVNQNNK